MNNSEGKIYKLFMYSTVISNAINKIPIWILRNFLLKINLFIFKYKLLKILCSITIEQLLMEFAQFSKAFNLNAGKLKTVRKMYSKDDDESGIDYSVLVNNLDVVTGINITIWTKDRMAKLNLELYNNYGEYILTTTWFIKNKEGLMERYTRSDILESQDEIKDILIDHIYNNCLCFYKFAEAQSISPSR